MERYRRDRLAGLDTLRAVAIVLVMAFHLNWRLPVGFAVAGKFGWMGVVHDAWPRVMDARDWRSVVVYAGSCLIVAAGLYYGVERPFLRLRDRRTERGSADVDLEARVEPGL